MTAEVTVRVSARTDVGNHREHNEDDFLVADLTARTRHLPDEGRTVGPHGIVLAVCDGMGGAAAGEVASDMAVETLYDVLVAGTNGAQATARDELAERIGVAARQASERIHQDAVENAARQGMGTTFTAAGLVDHHLFFGQVGDTRGYVLRDDELVQITRDQSLLAKLLESGALRPEEAATFEHSNIILQALGASPEVVVELTYIELRRGDRVLLCSDGLSGLVPADEIAGILGAQAEPTRICIELIERAKDLGGDDNVTAIVAFFDGPGLAAGPAPVVVKRWGPDPALPPIPDPRALGALLQPMASAGGTALLGGPAEAAAETEPVAVEPVPLEPVPLEPAPLEPAPLEPVAAAASSARPHAATPPPSIAADARPSQAPPRSSRVWVAAAVLLALALLGGAALNALSSDARRSAPTAASSTVPAVEGASTWTSVEPSAGLAPPPVAAGEVRSAQPVAAARPPEPRGPARVEGPARPVASVRPASPLPPGSARKGELAPIRDEPAE